MTLSPPGILLRFSQRTSGVKISAIKIDKKRIVSIGAISRIPTVSTTAKVLYTKILTGIELFL